MASVPPVGRRSHQGPGPAPLGHGPRAPTAVPSLGHARRDASDWRPPMTPNRSWRSTTARSRRSTATFDLVPRSLDEQRDVAGRPVGGVHGDRGRARRRRGRRRGRRLRLAVAVQGAGRLPHHRRGLRVRAPRPHRAGDRAAAPARRLVDIARDSGFHAVIARIEAGRRRVAGPARGVRLRAGRRRAPGRPQVRPLARRRRHANRAVNSWAGKDLNLRRHSPADLQSAPFGRSGTDP